MNITPFETNLETRWKTWLMRKGKRQLVFTLLVLLLTLPAGVRAQYNYTTNNGTISITKYTGNGGVVSIPGKINGLPVTSIASSAFDNKSNLTTVKIPDTVTTIGHGTFHSCTSLSAITVDSLNSAYSSVDGVLFNKNQTALIQCPGGKAGSYTVPSSVTRIECCAFCICTNLTNVTIPNSVTRIGNYAFSECTSLTSITIPKSVTSVESSFPACKSLSAITVDSLNPAYSSVDGVLFNKNQTALIQCPGGKAGSYTVPNSVTRIESSAFEGCNNLTSVTIPNGVSSIEDSVFSECTSLTNITIPNSVTSIGGAAFYSCTRLTSVTIPKGVANIGSRGFYGCTNLTGVYFQGNAPRLGSFVFSGDNKVTVYFLPGTEGWDTTYGGRPTMRKKP